MDNAHQSSNSHPLHSQLDQNVHDIQTIFQDCSDLACHSFRVFGTIRAVLFYMDGMVNLPEIDANVLAPLSQKTDSRKVTLAQVRAQIAVANTQAFATLQEAVDHISAGSTILLLEHESRGLSFGLAKWEKRSVEEPMAEAVIRGPRDGFTETLLVNTALLRRKIKGPRLKMKSLTIGSLTQTQVIISYLDQVADPKLVAEVEHRLRKIEIESVLESAYLEDFIADNRLSPFPQLMSTERPDVAAASLLEGRVVILVDGTPVAMVAPITLFALLQSPSDYYEGFWIGTFIRWLRYLFFAVALLAPSAYVAILTYHQEMVPTTLLLTIATSREQIPFPALVEALIMEITFEALREAGVRLPKQVGSAVSIVGALVIGQAATAAGIVSSPMVMVVAITGVASFMIPHYAAGIALRLLRFPVMFLAGILGLLGVMLGIIAIVIHLCSLRSFGVAYLSPLAPFRSRRIHDTLIMAPMWEQSDPEPQKGEEVP